MVSEMVNLFTVIFLDAQGVRIGAIIAAVYDIVICAIWWLL